MCDLSALIRRDKSGKHPLFFLLLPLLLAKHAVVAAVVVGVTKKEGTTIVLGHY